MHEFTLLEILAAGFGLALLFGYLAKRFNLSPIVGYLLAGFLVGPQSPGFVADAGLAMQLSEAGVILLMFGVGLHFNMDDLLAVKGVALPGAIIQASMATVFGTIVAMSFGMHMFEGLMLGMGLAVASTVVLLRVLEDANVVDTVHGHVAVGWLVVEDIITVLIMVLLPSLATVVPVLNQADAAAAATGSLNLLGLAGALGLAIVRLVILWVLVLVVGGRIVPWLLSHIARTRSQELFTLAILGMAFATAVGAALFFQASVALGAFLGGMVIGKTELSHQAGADILPLRDAFAVLFFLSVGMLFDPSYVAKQPLLILCSVLIVLVVKPLTAMVVVTILGYSAHTALTVAIGLAQVGEFSFILAQQAHDVGIISMEVYSVLVICAVVSITLNPTLFSQIPRMENWMKRRKKLWHILNAKADAKAMRGNATLDEAVHNQTMPDAGTSLAIVVGYGPTGRCVCNALKENGMLPVVVEMNIDTVNKLVSQGQAAIYGDSTKHDILLAAGMDRASFIVVTMYALEPTVATAAMARSMNAEARILVRARFMNEKKLLQSVGASGIAYEEEEVANALTNMVLEDLRIFRQASASIPMAE